MEKAGRLSLTRHQRSVVCPSFLEMKLEGDGHEILIFFLQLEFPCAMNYRDDRFKSFVPDRTAAAQVRHEQFLVHAVTVGKGISIEKDIPSNDSSIRARKDVS